MIGSKVTTINSLVFLCFFYQSTVDNGGVRKERSVAVGVSDRWKVACDM